MTIDSFIRRLDRTFSWLYYKHQWAEWELLLIAIIAMALLFWILKRQKNALARSTYNNQSTQHSSIIGIKLADHHHNRQVIEDVKEHRSDLIAQLSGKKKRKVVAKHIESLNGQIMQLQNAINKYKDMEDRFVEKIAELTVVNEQLRNEVEKYKHEEQPTQQSPDESVFVDEPQEKELPENELTSARIEHEQDASQPQRVVESLKLEVRDSTSAERCAYKTNRQHHRMVIAELQGNETSEEDTEQPRHLKRDDEPLDVQKLKSIAELARQIQGYPRNR